MCAAAMHGAVDEGEDADPRVEQRGADAAGLYRGGGGGKGGALREAVEGAGGLEGEGHGVPGGERGVGVGAAEEGEEEERGAEGLRLARGEGREGAQGSREGPAVGRGGEGVGQRGEEEAEELRGPELFVSCRVVVLGSLSMGDELMSEDGEGGRTE